MFSAGRNHCSHNTRPAYSCGPFFFKPFGHGVSIDFKPNSILYSGHIMKKKIKKVVKKVMKKNIIKREASAQTAARTSAHGHSKIMPLGDRVLVKPFIGNEQAAEANSFGIIIPETVSKERPEQGVVTAVGDGRTTDDGALVPMKVAVGDTVVFSKYGFDEVKMSGEEFYIIKEENILAIIRK